jgi:hypothetical protein
MTLDWRHIIEDEEEIKMRPLCRALGAVVIGLAWANPSWAVTYSASGTTSKNADDPNQAVSATANVTFGSGGSTVLTIVLKNTTSGGTHAQGSALTGIGFGYEGKTAPTLTLTGISRGTSDIYTGNTKKDNTTKLFQSSPKKKSWTEEVDKGNTKGVKFGVATTGVDIWKGSSISFGNASPDYGIVAAGTFPRSKSGLNKTPFIQDALTFTLNVSGTLDFSKIENVKFFFGTSGDFFTDGGTIHGPSSVPEPSGLAFAGIGALGLIGYRLRRRAA